MWKIALALLLMTAPAVGAGMGKARSWCEWAVDYNHKDNRWCEIGWQCELGEQRTKAKAMKTCLQEYRQGARRPGF